jgi:hypothetical protein
MWNKNSLQIMATTKNQRATLQKMSAEKISAWFSEYTNP